MHTFRIHFFVTVKNVIVGNMEIPLFVAEEHDKKEEVIDKIIESIETSYDFEPERKLEKFLAVFSLRPSQEYLVKILNTIKFLKKTIFQVITWMIRH